MVNAFIGEIRISAVNYAPKNWAFCNGELVAVSAFTALYALVGIAFGGNGRSNFALPEMRGRTPVGAGPGPGLTPHQIGGRFGEPTVTLTLDRMPKHDHAMVVSKTEASQDSVSGSSYFGRQNIYADKPDSVANSHLAAGAIGTTGSAQPHGNYMPSLVLNFIICLTGIYPPPPQ